MRTTILAKEYTKKIVYNFRKRKQEHQNITVHTIVVYSYFDANLLDWLNKIKLQQSTITSILP